MRKGGGNYTMDLIEMYSIPPLRYSTFRGEGRIMPGFCIYIELYSIPPPGYSRLMGENYTWILYLYLAVLHPSTRIQLV